MSGSRNELNKTVEEKTSGSSLKASANKYKQIEKAFLDAFRSRTTILDTEGDATEAVEKSIKLYQNALNTLSTMDDILLHAPTLKKAQKKLVELEKLSYTSDQSDKITSLENLMALAVSGIDVLDRIIYLVEHYLKGGDFEVAFKPSGGNSKYTTYQHFSPYWDMLQLCASSNASNFINPIKDEVACYAGMGGVGLNSFENSTNKWKNQALDGVDQVNTMTKLSQVYFFYDQFKSFKARENLTVFWAFLACVADGRNLDVKNYLHPFVLKYQKLETYIDYYNKLLSGINVKKGVIQLLIDLKDDKYIKHALEKESLNISNLTSLLQDKKSDENLSPKCEHSTNIYTFLTSLNTPKSNLRTNQDDDALNQKTLQHS